MACGSPIVASRAGAIPELADGAAVLFDPHSPEEIAEAILKTVSDSDLRRSLSERQVARAKEFTWDRCAAQTLQVLEEVTEE